jgi:hypothetical protein
MRLFSSACRMYLKRPYGDKRRQIFMRGTTSLGFNAGDPESAESGLVRCGALWCG